MARGLEGKRIALFAGAEADALRTALQKAGGLVEDLLDGRSRTEAAWHAARYAAIVVGSGSDGDLRGRVVQLLRESLLSAKPIVVIGNGLPVLEEAGGSEQDALIVRSGPGEDPGDAVRLLADRLAEREVDETSDLSFPASDPPAITPASIGARRSPDTEAR